MTTAALLLVLAGPLAGDASLCPAPEARQFDFWIGQWDIVNLQRNPRTPENPTFYPTGSARNIVYPSVGGCAIVEHWEGVLGWGHMHGFSLRTYNPDEGVWQVLANWPFGLGPDPNPTFTILEGGFSHGRVELKNTTTRAGKKTVTRFTFSDIQPDALRWDQAFSTDDGLGWRTSWIMEFTRRPVESSPHSFVGVTPQGSALRCKARQLDGLSGVWTGQRTQGGDKSAVTVRSYPILAGCASMDFMEGPEYEAFRVRAFDPGTERWVQYRLDSVTRRLERSEGTVTDGVLELEKDESWKLEGDKLAISAPKWSAELSRR